jgi:cell wall-associated NlpC family hydrolase
VTRTLVRTLAAMAAVVLLVAAGVVALLFVAESGTDNTPSGGSSSGSGCLSTITGLGAVQGLDADQLANAQTIITVGQEQRIPDRGLVVALATAMQESTMRNLTYGDRDSVGLFQQRPSAGWGTVTELTTPQTAAGKFYAALQQVSGWQSMPVTVAAQRVQRSAFPLAYAKWEALADAILAAARRSPAPLSCSSNIGVAAPSGTVGDMLRTALGQQGKPYVWGATGPDSFDCSGLVVYAWRMAGFRVAVRTSQQMYAVSDPVAFGQEQPGDLLFGEFGADGPGHVMIVVRPGLAVQAPRTGDVVKLSTYSAGGGWTIGRLHSSVLQALPA